MKRNKINDEVQRVKKIIEKKYGSKREKKDREKERERVRKTENERERERIDREKGIETYKDRQKKRDLYTSSIYTLQ